MSTPEFDKFDLEGLSLEDMAPVAKKADVTEKAEIPNSTDALENILDAESAQVEEIEPAPAPTPESAEDVDLVVQDDQTGPRPSSAPVVVCMWKKPWRR